MCYTVKPIAIGSYIGSELQLSSSKLVMFTYIYTYYTKDLDILLVDITMLLNIDHYLASKEIILIMYIESLK